MLTLEKPPNQPDGTSLDARNWRSRQLNRDVTEILDHKHQLLAKIWRIGDVSATALADGIIDAVIERQSRAYESGGGSEPTAESTQQSAHAAEINATPNAISFAKEVGVDLRDVVGSGKDGRINKEDVVQHLEGGEAS